MKLPEITEIKRLEIRPGDRLILRLSDLEITKEQSDEIRCRVREALMLPDDMPIVILASEWDAQVLSDGQPGG